MEKTIKWGHEKVRSLRCFQSWSYDDYCGKKGRIQCRAFIIFIRFLFYYIFSIEHLDKMPP